MIIKKTKCKPNDKISTSEWTQWMKGVYKLASDLKVRDFLSAGSFRATWAAEKINYEVWRWTLIPPNGVFCGLNTKKSFDFGSF